MPPFGMEIAVNAAANPCHSHWCCSLPACIHCLPCCCLETIQNQPFSRQSAHKQQACPQIRLGLEILSSLQIAHPTQCSCILVPTCWMSIKSLPSQKKLTFECRRSSWTLQLFQGRAKAWMGSLLTSSTSVSVLKGSWSGRPGSSPMRWASQPRWQTQHQNADVPCFQLCRKEKKRLRLSASN